MASTDLFFFFFFSFLPLSSRILTPPPAPAAAAATPPTTRKPLLNPPCPLLLSKMAHGGAWTLDQMIYLVVMKLATRYGWKRVAEEFRARFGSEATAKDVESKFNKDLKKSKIFRVVRDWIDAETIPDDDIDGVCILLDALLLWGEIPSEDRVF
ncbi:hypothetical protein PMAA_025770 [Talaromyces marneffei ATCC 18224]|uniref:Myb-like domain-containing protein n=2 Tax=Talaromyces marneffei TaxID=37727 RepID=B6Q7H4_TALMQ|nr:hypothetical protein PMAA_025770 [Talaromyces marneffei ATCC 18224]